MTPKQKAWTDKQINLIIDPIKKVGPLSMTDEQWEAVNKKRRVHGLWALF